ncbi:uncharacterized protein LOC126975002 [Leptidea sinapis]|uniref:Uncharacterized protein n=1 Tax=Leptidea sinapis TaxID=189913 RepID=A0A5E4Q9U0_9NEOP|nr:uncharacterized protein LOC126975002 [Leptidea sinapis]VVC94355.1 unnamed protein product [Leptidea sinapis]
MSLSTRAPSPTRADAIAKSLKCGPVFCTGVLLGNWVEDRIECPKGGTLYFPPKGEIDYEKLKPESRQPEFRINKLNGLQGNVHSIYRHDSHDGCGNFATTTDLVYNHLPKPLCGPIQRYYKRCAHQFYPQPDLMKCFGNVTEWGLQKYLEHEWKCTDVSDYSSSLYEDTYTPPKPHQYLQLSERKARNSSFTKTFRFKMTKPKQ